MSFDEFAPLTCNHLQEPTSSSSNNNGINNNGNINNTNRHHSHTTTTTDHEDEESDESDDDIAGGFTNYTQPKNRFFNRTVGGRYSGYCTLDVGRVSLHDSWDFDNNKKNGSRGDDDEADDNGHNNGEDDDDADDNAANGDFISFWGAQTDDDDDGSDGSSCDYGGNSGTKQTQPQQQQQTINRNGDNDNDNDDDDDRVETTMRPIPLLYRKYQGGLHRNNVIHEGSSSSNNNDNGTNNLGSWFQRELGLANLHFDESNSRSRRRRRWGFGRQQQYSSSEFDDFDNSEEEDKEDEELMDGNNNDANSLLASSSLDKINNTGHCMIHHPTTDDSSRSQSPFRYNHRLSSIKDENNNGNIFGRRKRGEGIIGAGILNLPIVRPFLRGTRRGFTDDTADESNHMDDGDVGDMDDGNDDDNLPSRRQDRAAVIQSISRGITGTNNDSLLLDDGPTVSPDGRGGDIDEHDYLSTTTNKNEHHPPNNNNFLGRIFLTRFLPPPNNVKNNSNNRIIQLHNLLRKEDWSLATNLLESNPNLASTWHHIDRLYGGRYDGEALPIHAACALCPPSTFIEMLAGLYPGGLVEKDKAFGRVALHVACRSLASSSVIRVLCEMDPKCVEERDSLKRVPLHYLIKNYCTFGNDDDDDNDEDDVVNTNIDEEKTPKPNNTNKGEENNNNTDGMTAMKILIRANPNCVHAPDHRGWLPIHVACSCSSRKGMMCVLRVLLRVWPESINAKTEKDSDVFACVDMAGKHHPTKERVLALLREAKCKVDNDNVGQSNGARPDNDDESSESGDEMAVITDGEGNDEQAPVEYKSLSKASCEVPRSLDGDDDVSSSPPPQCEVPLRKQSGDLLLLDGDDNALSLPPPKCAGPTEKQSGDLLLLDGDDNASSSPPPQCQVPPEKQSDNLLLLDMDYNASSSSLPQCEVPLEKQSEDLLLLDGDDNKSSSQPPQCEVPPEKQSEQQSYEEVGGVTASSSDGEIMQPTGNVDFINL